MSDYMFMLENHLTAEQGRALAEVSAAAAQASVNLFLTGGAVRDMIGGSPIRDLDFTIEGNALKIAKTVAQKAAAEILSIDEHRKRVAMRFPGGVSAEIAMARQERYSKPGARPHVTAATIHEDLRGRDFTINSLALSLNKASRGLLLDPNNGLSDLENKELRAVGNYTFYDDPIRIFRLYRFRVRFGFQVAERTLSQCANAREAEVEKQIAPRTFYEELSHIAAEPNPGEVLQILEHEKLLTLIAPFLAGPKLNLQGFAKLQKGKQLLPFGFGLDLNIDDTAIFFWLLTEKLAPKERAAFVKAIAMERSEALPWQTLETKAKKLEKDLKSARLQKPSQVYAAMIKAPGEQLLFLLTKSAERLVLDRIRNYYQKYLPAAQEVTEREVAASGVTPGTPKYNKAKEQMIATRLDSRPKKVPVPPEVPVVPTPGRGPAPGPIASRKQA
jgi:tRNA nucleotidyltransferase (CCA-adding enzyme)